MASYGVEPENIAVAGAGVAMSFPVNDSSSSSPSSSPTKLPSRLRRRLSECRSPSTTTVEDIEAKLNEARLRRQQFYELLSSKARPRHKSPPDSSDLGQRLEAKLNAAEQKRLNILAKAQKRLARLDKMRQAARNELEMRAEKQRDELGMKVESRVQQAENNRMLILKSRRQQRAARLVHVQRAANSIHAQREMERLKMKDQLEDRLQRARRLRAELLRQRKNASCSPYASALMMSEKAETLARKLARSWRRFVKMRGTTYALTKAFESLNISEKKAKSMPFEQLALLIGSDATLKAVQSFLDRLEVHLKVRQGTTYSSRMEDINHLLKRVATPKRRSNVSHANKSRGQKRAVPVVGTPKSPRKLSRYPVRIALCAYMILGHPDAVLSSKGVHETALAEAAVRFVQEFELLEKVILEGGCVKSSGGSCVTFRAQLEAFDKAWCSYLYCFTVWKVKDAKLLEEDLVRAACQLELSMMHTCKLTPDGNKNGLTHDMKAIQKQVFEDQTLLKAKVQHLSGDSGIDRLESALCDVRSKFFALKENGDPMASPVAHISTPSYSGSSSGSSSSELGEGSNTTDVSERLSSVARSLFKDDHTSSKKVVTPIPPAKQGAAAELSYEMLPVAENELLANEIIHEHRHGFADHLVVSDEDNDDIKVRIKETMEKAFWDGVVDSMKQDQPDLSWVLKLVTEIRDELCGISPGSLKQEITDKIDVDILSQVLSCGTLDMDYLGKILEYALATLQKLSAPANDDEMKAANQTLLRELSEVSQTGDNSKSSGAIAVVKGLRFVLQQIQTLKREIFRTHMRMIEPLLKGPSGLEYLQKAFSNRYGPPSDASSALPLTKNWLSLLRADAEQEWNDYTDSISALPSTQSPNSVGSLPTTLRTGGGVSASSRTRVLELVPTGKEQPECRGERVDLMVRLGLLKLVSKIDGLVQETLPETLKLNVARLRGVQSLLQKIIVTSTSTLVLRQTLVSERLVTSPSDMETIVSESSKLLSELLDRTEDVGIPEMVEALTGLPDGLSGIVDLEKLKSRKEVMGNLLLKSLRSGDPIFTRVSRAIYVAMRGALLGGTGSRGRQVAETALKRIGAAFLTGKVMEASEKLIVMATVSGSVHRAWYEQLLSNV